jgi:eukaryotic-like serine/threonine-protein kinase
VMPEGAWAALADFLDSTQSKQDTLAICMNISGERICELCAKFPVYANQIGLVYADWVYRTSFNFDHCDGIANRLDIFFTNCNFETKIESLIAMLELGTSHNRWYVERKFFNLCTPVMDPSLAKRLAIEFRVRDNWICSAVDHLERSISVNRNQLHPEIVQALAEICQ